MRLIKLLTIVIVFSMICTSSMCSSDEPNLEFELLLENQSKGTVWFRVSLFNIEKDSYIPLGMYHIYIVRSGKTEKFRTEVPNDYNNLYFEFVVINEENVKNYTQEELIEYSIYDKKYFMSYNELKSLNYKISYSDDK